MILRLPQLFFLGILEFWNEDLEDIGIRVSSSFAGQFPIFFGLSWSVFDFEFFLAQSVLLTGDQ